MGIFKEIGNGLGSLAGAVIGTPIKVIGEITEIKLIEDIGDGVKKASTFAGDTLGTFTDGAVGVVTGIIQEDEQKKDEGLNNLGNAVTTTAKGVYHTAKNVVVNSREIIGGAIDGDMESVKKGAAGIVTTVAVGALAIGIVDILDGVDVADGGTEVNQADASTGTHHVDSHHVEGYVKDDGTVVADYWRGGEEGYERSNPDDISNNNLNS